MPNDHLLFDLPIYKKPDKQVEPLAPITTDSIPDKSINNLDSNSFFDKLDKFFGFKE